jgi:hypothetical protein
MRTRPEHFFAAAVLIAAFIATPTRTEAGTIGFQIQTTVHTGATVRVELNVRHTGDEGARDVEPSFELLGRRVGATKKEYVGPGTTAEWEAEIPTGTLEPGNYVLVTRLAYADANAYPFEVLAMSPFTVNAAPLPRATGTFELPDVPSRGAVSGRLELRLPDQRGDRYEVEVVAPAGVRITPARTTTSRGEDGRATVPLNVTNRNLLVGTSLEVFALVSSPDQSPPQTDMIRGVVTIREPRQPLTTEFFVRLAVGLAVLLVVLQAIHSRRSR